MKGVYPMWTASDPRIPPQNCPFDFPDLPKDFAKYDLKLEGQAGIGVTELDMERGRKVRAL